MKLMNYVLPMSAQRAATTRIEPGHHSIDRAVPRQRGNVWLLDWSVRLPDGRLMPKRSQGATKGQVRQRAKATAAELLTSGGGTWKTTSSLHDYVNQISRAVVTTAKLEPSSRTRYFLALNQLVGECNGHSHTDSLRGHSIASGTRFRALEGCLKEIAQLHGTESARQARSVLSKYVLQQLNRDELIHGNPIAGMSIDLTSAKPARSKEGAQSLTKSQYYAVVDHLLALDPVAGQTKPRLGRWSLEDRIARRRNAIDLTLLQAATGLRVSEANQITWNHVETDDNGTIHINVTADISKTHRGRRVPVTDDSIAQRVLSRQNAAESRSAYVIGTPADQMTVWDRGNCQKTTTALYKELSKSLEIERLTTLRTHLWRATLNSLLLDEVPEVARVAFFGHNTATNRGSYTDLADTSGMVSAARRLRAG